MRLLIRLVVIGVSGFVRIVRLRSRLFICRLMFMMIVRYVRATLVGRGLSGLMLSLVFVVRFIIVLLRARRL